MTQETQRKVEFTPGPWHINANIRDELYIETHNPVMPFICDLQLRGGIGIEPDYLPMVQANARLIASAPEGYELAQTVLTIHAYLGYPTNFKTIVAKAVAIVAKVEGGDK